MIPEIDEEWTEFLKSIPETELTIQEENVLFEKEKKRWCVKMSMKYGFDVNDLKEKYGRYD